MMSVMTSTSSTGWGLGIFGRLFRGRKSSKASMLTRMIYILDRIVDDLDASRKRMEDRYNDLAKKAKAAALKGDKESHNIFLNEMDEVSKFIALIVHAKKYVLQIKLRLETMLEIGESIEQLPAIMSELSNLKPVLAKVTPYVVEKISEFERLAAEILASTSIPSVYGKVRPENKGEGSTINIEELLPPKNMPSRQSTQGVRYNRVSLSLIKKWLLEEISLTNGFLIIDDFVRKYGVSKEAVLEALRQLHEEGKILIRK